MGTWGPGLYQNDVSDDVKTIFRDRLHRGKTCEQVTAELISENREEIEDAYDSLNFWCALADTQWNLGRLLPAVKEAALECLDRKDHLDLWKDNLVPWEKAGAKLLNKRQQVLDALRDKLNTPQPPEKKISQYKLYHCPWKIGDVYALPFSEEHAGMHGFEGQYLLIQKVDEDIWWPGHTIPIVNFKITKTGKLPDSLAEYNNAEYIQTRVSKCWREAFDLDTRIKILRDEVFGLCKPEDFNIHTDEFGNLLHYRVSLITTSKRSYPKSLIYVGNYADATRPHKEFIQHDKICYHVCKWKELFAYINECYYTHNKRNSPYYTQEAADAYNKEEEKYFEFLRKEYESAENGKNN